MVKRSVAVFALIIVTVSGCGTVMNLTETQSPTYPLSSHSQPRTPYGGVAYDWDVGPWMAFGGNPVGIAACACYLAVDMPLSAVGDTLTLPYVLYARAHPGQSNSESDRRANWSLYLQEHQQPAGLQHPGTPATPATADKATDQPAGVPQPKASRQIPYERVEGGLE